MSICEFEYNFVGNDYPLTVIIDKFVAGNRGLRGVSVDSAYPDEPPEICYRVIGIDKREIEKSCITNYIDNKIIDRAIELLQPDY